MPAHDVRVRMARCIPPLRRPRILSRFARINTHEHDIELLAGSESASFNRVSYASANGSAQICTGVIAGNEKGRTIVDQARQVDGRPITVHEAPLHWSLTTQ